MFGLVPGHHPNHQIYMVMTSPFVSLHEAGPLSRLVRNLTNLQVSNSPTTFDVVP